MKRKSDYEIESSNKKPRNTGNSTGFPAQNHSDKALQSIVNAFRYPGIQAFEDLATLMKAQITMVDCEALLRNLTVYLTRNRNIAHNEILALTSLVTSAFHTLERLLNDASNSGFVAWEKSLAQNRKVQAVAFLIYNCGKIAEKRLNIPALSAANMEILLHYIQTGTIRTTKSIGNGLYGLGLLAEAGKIRGDIKASSVQGIFKILLSLPDLETQHISNSLYALCCLAKAGKLRGNIEASSMQGMFNKLLSLPNLDAQHISNSTYATGCLAKEDKLQGDIDASSMQAMFNTLLSLKDWDTQALSNSLYGLGCLAKAAKLKGDMEASFLQAMFDKLLSFPSLKVQHIGNSLHALGCLAKVGKLKGDIEASSVQAMFNTLLLLKDLDSQAISNSLYGLGLLAEAGNIQGDIDVLPMQAMFDKLLSLPNLKAQHISNSLYGIGCLAKAGKIRGYIEASSVQGMFNILPSLPGLNTQEISNSLYGLGCLANAGKLRGDIRASSMQEMFRMLLSLPNFKTQHISNSLYGLGLLAEAGNLHGDINTSTIQDMFRILLSLPNLNTQEISNSLYGLGWLAKAGKLRGDIKAYSIQAMFDTLLTSTSMESQAITNSLYSLGCLAKVGKLQGDIEASSLQGMFKILPSLPNLKTQEISNSLYGLGLLAEAGKLCGVIPANILRSLLEKLMVQNPPAIHARQTLNGLSRLMPRLNPPLVANDEIKQLIRIVLNVPYVHPTHAAVLLGNLVALKDLQDNDTTRLFQETIGALGIRFKRFPLPVQKQLQANIQALATRPDWQLMLQQQLGLEQANVPVMETDIPEPVRMSTPKPVHRTLIANILPRPVARNVPQPEIDEHSAHYKKACNDRIFHAIATKNEENLRTILHILKELSATAGGHATPAAGQHIPQNRPFVPISRSHAEELVTHFLYMTHATALRELVSQSPAQYFILLLQACSAHTRFQLARNNILHPIIINLASKELPALMDKLSSPFQIYRDHQALLHVIDALTIRAEKNPREHKDIKQLQTALLTEGLRFHGDCKHHHVIQRLKLTKTRFEKNELLLLDMNDNADDAPSIIEECPSTPAKTTSQAQKPPAVIPVSSTTMLINNKYQYETEDIQAILAARMKPYPLVSVMAAAQMNSNIPGNSLAEVLASYIRKRLVEGNQEHSLLLPIQLSGHWVGLMVSMQGNTITALTYFNSSKNEISDNQRMTQIKNQLWKNKLIHEDQNVKPAERVMQQCDASSCGALLIENFYCSFKKMWHGKENKMTDRDTNLIRQRHLEILKAERPDYYPGFYNKQANNHISVPDLETQQRSHGITSRFFKAIPVTNQPDKVSGHARVPRG